MSRQAAVGGQRVFDLVGTTKGDWRSDQTHRNMARRSCFGRWPFGHRALEKTANAPVVTGFRADVPKHVETTWAQR